jgi:hypothetical protein
MVVEGKNETETTIDTSPKLEDIVEPSKPTDKKSTIICIGEYPIKILLHGSLIEKKDESLPIFIWKFSRDITEWSQSSLSPDRILGLDLNVDTHFWFQVLPHIKNDDAFIGRLKDKSINSLHGAVLVTSLWDGVGSGLLPALISHFKEWNINTVAFGILPSQMQVSDAYFNAFSSLGISVSEGFASLLLIDRDNLESYTGVNRSGSVLKGKFFVNYLLELVANKETFVQEITELSRAFDVRMYTLLSATGASFSMYGSIQNILKSASSRPLLKCDLSTASVLYVLFRLPLQLKEKLTKAKIELEIANWFKEKANLQSIYVSEPLYTDDDNDRIDIAMFVGGFDATKIFVTMEKKFRAIKNFVLKKGSIKKDEWQAIVKSLGSE